MITKDERRLREQTARRNAKTITHAELLEVANYNPDTGGFTRKTSPAKRFKPGQQMGCLQPSGYVRVRIAGKYYFAHRLAWFYVHGVWPPKDIDHINRDRADNRLSNLRCVTHQENMRNNGMLGVYLDRQKKKRTWIAAITVSGRQKYLGTFEDFFEAVCVRKSAEAKYF